MNKLKNCKGITMIALVVTIVILIVLASISIIEGKKLIKEAKIENILTDMITIKAKVKGYAEEINSEVWDLKENKEEKIKELFKQKYNIDNTDITNNDILSQIDSNITNKICFEISQSALTEMGLMDIAQSLSDEERQNYIMVYDVNDCTNLDIVCIEGIPYDGVSYYSLSCLQNKFREE